MGEHNTTLGRCIDSVIARPATAELRKNKTCWSRMLSHQLDASAPSTLCLICAILVPTRIPLHICDCYVLDHFACGRADGFTIAGNLQARSNDLRGPIPDDMYDLKEMRILYLQDNPKLSGSISEDIVKWPELEELQLQETGIGGALPLNLFKAQKLEKLFLHDAKFSGAIPDAIAQLVNLRDARLNNNTFSGAIPATLEQLTPVGNSTLSKSYAALPCPAI